MNRSALAVIGMAVATIGYALVYSGLSTLDPCITPWGVPVSTMVALVPGAKPVQAGGSAQTKGLPAFDPRVGPGPVIPRRGPGPVIPTQGPGPVIP